MSGFVLHVALREGFDDDAVVVEIGDEQFRFDALSTRLQIGLAEEIEVERPGGTVEVRVALPEAGVETMTSQRLDGERWLGVDRVGDSLEMTWSTEPFGYV